MDQCDIILWGGLWINDQNTRKCSKNRLQIATESVNEQYNAPERRKIDKVLSPLTSGAHIQLFPFHHLHVSFRPNYFPDGFLHCQKCAHWFLRSRRLPQEFRSLLLISRSLILSFLCHVNGVAAMWNIINLPEQSAAAQGIFFFFVFFYRTHLQCIKPVASNLHQIPLIGLRSAINRHYNHCRGCPQGHRQPLAF